MFIGVVPSAILYSLKLDSTWVNAASYSSIRSLYRGEVGSWYGMRILEATQPYRETVAGVEDESAGVVYNSFFFGQNAFGHTELGGIGTGIHVVRGPDTNEPIPRNTYVSWSQNFANKALTAPHCVGLMAGAQA
jgi:N4-gp56 family major capsid protein